MPRVVDPEGDRAGPLAGQIAHLWVVGVHDEQRLRGQRPRRRPPALRDVLQLAVAVELVTKEVPEQDRARPDAANDLRQRSLVDLEQAQLRVSASEKGRGDT